MDIHEIITHATCETFPVEHQPFYHRFEPWRLKKNKESNIKDGVYIVLAGKPVPRFLKEDNHGILYIGKGKVLPKHHRLGKLINAFNKTERMHSAGIRYNNDVLTARYPICDITVQVFLCEQPRALEANLLKQYMNEFGELPPFNHQS